MKVPMTQQIAKTTVATAAKQELDVEMVSAHL
jgi:hypothetical protein